MAEDLTGLIEIINGDHDPPFPFMVVDGYGMHVDFSGVTGELWDGNNVQRVTWGMRDPSGKRFGSVVLKNGEGRRFWNEELIWPYVKAYEARKDELNRAQAEAAARAAAERERMVITADDVGELKL